MLVALTRLRSTSLCTSCFITARSNSTWTYHSKVRALPFALSPEDAMYTLAPHASANCYFPNLLSSILAFFLPRELTKDRLSIFRPTRIEPVYFPGWVIDAEVEVDALSKDDSERPERQQTTFFSFDSYLPGCAFDPLSRLALISHVGDYLKTVPFTPSLQKQHGMDVTCLPYQISPLPVFDRMKRPPLSSKLEDDTTEVYPSSMKANMIAAYPVLFPLYIAQYERDEDSVYANAVRSASTPSDIPGQYTLVVNALHDRWRGATVYGKNLLWTADEDPQWNTLTADTMAFFRIKVDIMSSDPINYTASTLLKETAEETLLKTSTAAQLQDMTSTALDGTNTDMMDDLRAREYTRGEVMQNRGWMESGREHVRLKKSLKTIAKRFGSMLPMDSSAESSFAATLGKAVAHQEQQREVMKPSWLKEWETQDKAKKES